MIHVFWSLLFLIVYNFDKNEEIPESDKMLGIKIDKSAQIWALWNKALYNRSEWAIYGFDLIDIKFGQEKNA